MKKFLILFGGIVTAAAAGIVISRIAMSDESGSKDPVNDAEDENDWRYAFSDDCNDNSLQEVAHTCQSGNCPFYVVGGTDYQPYT